MMNSWLKLIKSCVAPCLLYAACTWTLTVDQERKLRVTQRAMLRQMVGARRRPEECWVDFIKRATHTSLALAERSSVEDWVSCFWKAKWTLAGKVAAASDRRWTARLIHWTPWFRVIARRSTGGQRKRWTDV